MKVYIKPPDVYSPSLTRVANALKKYKPSTVEIVNTVNEADFVVFHVIGRQDQMYEQALSIGKPYAVIQYALRSTMRPDPESWIDLWRNANVVWSYYDLTEWSADFNFYHAPLGVDESIKKKETQKRYLMMTSGQSYLTESVRECIYACRGLGKVFHLGEAHDIPSEHLESGRVEMQSGITDDEVSIKYSQSMYVSGLRRDEGFELPVIEGLVCGAKPIVFDKPHYRHWFDDFAIFIPENSRDEVVRSLKSVFSASPSPVTQQDIDAVRRKFNWSSITSQFWEKAL